MKLEEALQTTKFENEKHKALLNILYTGYWYKSQVSGVLKELDLTAEQFNVMRILKGKHPVAMCVKDIASRMIEKSSNVPRIIDRMLAKGYAERTQSATDKRETMVSLTAEGIKQLKIASKSMSKLTAGMIAVSEEEAGALNSLLEKFRGIEVTTTDNSK